MEDENVFSLNFLLLKIFFSVLNQKLPDDKIEIELNKKQKAFKKFLSPELHLRTTPNIQFLNDKKLSYQEKIDSLLKDTTLNQNISDNKS